MRRKRFYCGPPQTVKDHAVGNCVHQAAGDGAKSGKGLKGITGYRQRNGGRVAHAAARQLQKCIKLNLLKRHLVDPAQTVNQFGCQRTLNNKIRSRGHRCQRADHCAP